MSSDNSNSSVQDVLSVQGVNQVLLKRCPSRSQDELSRLDGDVSLLQGTHDVRSSTSALTTTHLSSCSCTMPGLSIVS